MVGNVLYELVPLAWPGVALKVGIASLWDDIKAYYKTEKITARLEKLEGESALETWRR